MNSDINIAEVAGLNEILTMPADLANEYLQMKYYEDNFYLVVTS